MSRAARELWLREAVSGIAGRSAAETGLHDDLGATIGLDSLGRLEVLAAVEEEFGFVFDDDDLTAASTLARMLDAIDSQLAREEA